jgi:hypothetical protein
VCHLVSASRSFRRQAEGGGRETQKFNARRNQELHPASR